MKIKQYQEADMRRAMRRVRDELGADAVIISTRTAADKVEVLAALDYDAELASQLQANLPGAAGAAAALRAASSAAYAATDANYVDTEKKNAGIDTGIVGTGNSYPGNTPATAAEAASEDAMLAIGAAAAPAIQSEAMEPVISGMQEELTRLRGLFEGELSELAWQEKGRRQPGQMVLKQQLRELGLSRELCGELLDNCTASQDLKQDWKQLMRTLAGQISVCQQDVIETGGIVAVVGPTGVGKTTTVAKLAARFALRHGRNQVALITTDRFRVGAQEQLYTFGSLLGVPVQAATSQSDLARALASLSDRKLVLIDTAGMSQRDMGLTDQFATLASIGADIKSYLVLSAIAQRQVINETIQSFSHIGLAGSIVTKIDEAASLGPVISALCRHQLPLAFIGNGQRVPEDILTARRESLVEEAIKLYRRQEAAASNTGTSGNG